MRLLVAIPCYNEEKTIEKVVASVPKKIKGIDDILIVVINDGSTDNTAEIAAKNGATVSSFNSNKGLGWAFSNAVSAAIKHTADILVTIDGDGQFDPKDIPKLVEPILNNKADFVTCSRFRDKAFIPEMSKIKLWGNKFMSKFVSVLVGQRFFDVSCGFRAYSKEALLNLNLFGKFTYTQEAFMDLAFKGIRIVEVPLKIRGKREFGKSRIADNLFKYGYRTLKIIFRTLRDYKPLKFFGSVGLLLFVVGLGFDGFLLYHWITARQLSPYKSFGFVGSALNAFGALIIILALIADMLTRIRMNQERMLYLEKKREYEKEDSYSYRH